MDDCYFLEKRAFEEFLQEPPNPRTLGLLRFALKPYVMRIQLYGRIPFAHWTPDVCAAVADSVAQNQHTGAFLPLIPPIIDVVQHVARTNTLALGGLAAYLKKKSTLVRLSDSERAVRYDILRVLSKRRRKKKSMHFTRFKQKAK